MNNSVTLPKDMSSICGRKRRNKNGTKYMKRLIDQPYSIRAIEMKTSFFTYY